MQLWNQHRLDDFFSLSLLVHLKNGSTDDDAVESIEGGVEVGGQPKSVHPHAWGVVILVVFLECFLFI